jgi:hypothetical protein
MEIMLPGTIHAAIREHARAVKPGHESVGRLRISSLTGRALEYHPLPNGADEPGKVRLVSYWRREPGEISIVCHSHPDGADGHPSDADLAYFGSKPWGRVFAIWSTERDFLRGWHMLGGEDEGFPFVEVPVAVDLEA